MKRLGAHILWIILATSLFLYACILRSKEIITGKKK